MGEKEPEKIWQNLSDLSLDKLQDLKNEGGKKIRWAREAFSPTYSRVRVVSDPYFVKLFQSNKGYSESKIKDVEKGEFGKGHKGFHRFMNQIAEFFNAPVTAFINTGLGEIEFKILVRKGWAARRNDSIQWTECKLCGYNTQNSFTCKNCGASGICREFCYDAKLEQCIKCSKKLYPDHKNINEFRGLKNQRSRLQVRVWSEYDDRSKTPRDITVTPQNDIPQYKIGDSVIVNFESSDAGYVYLFDIGPTGNLAMIFPANMPNASGNRIKGRITYKYPDKKQSWVLKGPAGTETLKIFLSRTKVDILESWLKELGESQFLKIDKRRISIVTQSINEIPPENWAEASCSLIVNT